MRRSRSIQKAVVVLLCLGGLAGTAGCSSASDDTSDTSTTEDSSSSDGDSSNGFAVSTPAGEVSLSLDGDLPPDWPDDFPLPAGSDAAGSGSLSGSDSGFLVAVFSTTGSAEDAYDFYDTSSELSPSDQRRAEVGSGFLGSMTISGAFDGSVTVTGHEDTTYVIVVLDTDGDSGGS